MMIVSREPREPREPSGQGADRACTERERERRTMDLPEFAALLGISKDTAYIAARRGYLTVGTERVTFPAIRVGERRWVVPRRWAEQLVGSVESPAPSAPASAPPPASASQEDSEEILADILASLTEAVHWLLVHQRAYLLERWRQTRNEGYLDEVMTTDELLARLEGRLERLERLHERRGR